MLTYRADGDGAPLILLNGGFMSMSAWDAFVPPLASSHRVIRCDLRGQLLTPGPYADSFHEHATDVLALLDHLDIARTDVAGVSFGGEVALVLAAMAPGRVERLTVITSTDFTDERMREDAREARELSELAAAGDQEAAEKMLKTVLSETWSESWLSTQAPDFIEARARQLSMMPPAFFAGSAALLRLLETLDLRGLLPRITAHTLVIGGEKDRIFPLERSWAIADAIPQAELKIVSGAGHGLLFERPDEVIGALR